MLKCVLYMVEGEPLAVFVPGHREVSEAKLALVLGTGGFHTMREDERELYPALVAGFVGPVALSGVRTLFDAETRGARGLICGANKPDYHLVGVEEGRDFAAEPAADVATARRGDLCAACGGELAVARGVEIGHIFKLGVKYTEPMRAFFTDRDGAAKPIIMGTYGIGTSRMLATVVERHHDGGGIKWPRAVAPLPVEVMVLSTEDAGQVSAAGTIVNGLSDRGVEVLIDDREASPGIKFNDADLVGLPIQVVAGRKTEDGKVDLKIRYTGERREVPLDGAVEAIGRAIEEAP